MSSSLNSIINLSAMSVALVESNNQGLDILAQIFSGFGVKGINRCMGVEDAKALLETKEIDLVITEAELADGDGYELIRWIRRCKRVSCGSRAS